MKADVLDNNRLDRWLQRGAVATMVAVAVTLMAIGFSLYSRPPASPSEFGKAAGPGTDNLTLTSTASK